MTKCLIIDDDPLICDLIKHFCSKLPWVQSCVSVIDGNQALQAINAEQFDLIFLDFNLPDLNGNYLLELFPSTIPVIMVTTEEQFGAESYAYDQIIDFLVKPISYERFLKAAMRFKNSERSERPTSKSNKIIVKDGNSKVVVELDQVRYVKSESNYVIFHLLAKKVMSLMRMVQLEIDLPAHFTRVHKSFIINLNYLESIGTDHLMVGGQEIPIGPKYKEQLQNVISNWMG